MSYLNLTDQNQFSVACLGCDAGQEIRDETTAIELGWTELEYDDDGAWWTCLGVCPECKEWWGIDRPNHESVVSIPFSAPASSPTTE